MALPVLGYPDYYVYEDGRVWSDKTNKFLKPMKTQGGYCYVQLFDGHKGRNFFVHRLVAMAFMPNPDNLPQVNHKDENPQNNHVDNLEWCTADYNMNYGNGAKTRHLHIDYSKPSYRENAIINGRAVSVPVSMFSTDGRFIASYSSIAEAGRETGINVTNISRAVLEKRKTAGGYIWRKGE